MSVADHRRSRCFQLAKGSDIGYEEKRALSGKMVVVLSARNQDIMGPVLKARTPCQSHDYDDSGFGSGLNPVAAPIKQTFMKSSLLAGSL